MEQVAKLLVVALALVLAGCASPPPPPEAPPTVDVRGVWKGRWIFENQNSSGEVTLEISQAGADVGGNATVTDRNGTRNSFFTGTVTGNRIILKPPYSSGVLEVNGDEMTGVVEGIMPANVTLRRQH
ncbi:MAG TPA: hypothetical protein VEL75_12525 [Candidatus Methylomirabilis sp.]|nr:hypothetical protein [Candidatus Methylomirabilis sp.]